MGQRRALRRIVLLAALALLLAASTSWAQRGGGVGTDAGRTPAVPEGPLEISWWTVDGGGGMSSAAAGISLEATVGQPDAGAHTGAGYDLRSGFWGGGALAGLVYDVFLPLVLKNGP
jgi:hypothetical protein